MHNDLIVVYCEIHWPEAQGLAKNFAVRRREFQNNLILERGMHYHTVNQLPRQRKHGEPVTQVAKALATSYPSTTSTGNQLAGQRKHMQPVIQATTQATIYPGSTSTRNQL